MAVGFKSQAPGHPVAPNTFSISSAGVFFLHTKMFINSHTHTHIHKAERTW